MCSELVPESSVSNEETGKLRAGIRANVEGRELGLRPDSKCSPRGKGGISVGDAISVDCEKQIGGLQDKVEVVLREDKPGGRLTQASSFPYETYNFGL